MLQQLHIKQQLSKFTDTHTEKEKSNIKKLNKMKHQIIKFFKLNIENIILKLDCTIKYFL